MEEHHGNANSAGLQASFGTYFFLMLAEKMLIISAEIDQNRGPGL